MEKALVCNHGGQGSSLIKFSISGLSWVTRDPWASFGNQGRLDQHRSEDGQTRQLPESTPSPSVCQSIVDPVRQYVVSAVKFSRILLELFAVFKEAWRPLGC